VATNIVFIVGGARSGKSTLAEELSAYLQGKKESLHYVATAQVTDDEMARRVKKHQKQRAHERDMWTTWEYPCNIHELATTFNQSHIVLMDCLTTLLANELFQTRKSREQVFQSIIYGVYVIAANVKTLIIVSNEILYQHVPQDSFVHKYCQLIGLIHQEIVRKAQCAIHVEAGIPILIKGNRYWKQFLNKRRVT